MKNLWDLQKNLFELLVEHLPYRHFVKVKEIVKQIINVKEIYADDNCHCECEQCKSCKNK